MFEEPFQRRVIYIFAIHDATHKGLLKIGDTTLKSENISPEQAARDRISQYTNTAAIPFELLHTELAVDNKNNSFRDYDVHRVLKKYRTTIAGTKAREWFKIDLATAIRAIKAVKLGRKNLSGIVQEEFIPITFRPEQKTAISRTVEYFSGGGKDFLWNAKMRFGKTLCALEVVKRMKFVRTIILTHRPVVNAGWYDDFDKIFGDTNYIYRDKDSGIGGGKNFVYFASIQDLRGSEVIGGKFDKNNEIFSTSWNFIIVDEAHEGTTTELGAAVIKELVKKNSKLLKLSGTPFNILEDFTDANTYTWSYIDEQRVKATCEVTGDLNPYADLPAMKIFTYNLGEVFSNAAYVNVEEMAFKFSEFFSTDGKNFVHAADVQSFLDLLTTAENYPYSRADWRKIFKHTLWIIPGVKEGKVLSKLLQRHKIFSGFKIVNVAGNGDSDDEPADALKKVQDAIKAHDYTITLSCGKLTAGVTVPEWTTVFMLRGGSSSNYKTSAASYLQTIFRVQSPGNIGGRVKQNCYVFDFAPDRTLTMITAYAKVSSRAGKTTDADRQKLGELLNFCPVIALDGSEMKTFDADKLFTRLKRACIERTVQSGFSDNYLYNDELLNLDKLALEKFAKLKKILGASNAQHKTGEIVINDQGLDDEKRTGSKKTTKSPQDKELAKRKQLRRNAISILRGISIRMPLLIYGADVPFDEDISIDEFAEIVDDASWAEFMPKGVTKELFGDFIKYYDRDIFIEAGRRIRALAKSADELTPTARVEKISELFATFRNPDKETVLTPWNVVKLHIDSAFDKTFFTPDKHVLEINSKTGLYPLYVACKIYRASLGNFSENDFKPEALLRIWDNVVAENVFVICKTPMAETVTRRTLLGFRSGIVNAHCFDNLIDALKNNPAQIISQITDKNFWSKGVGKMFFDAVVGNPPYQIATSNTSDEPVYNLFIDAAFQLADKVSLIHPARCLSNAGKTPKDFNQRVLNNPHVKIVKYFRRSQEAFPTSDIKGGVVITLYDANQTFEPIGTFIPFDELIAIHQKVVVDNPNFSPFSEIIYPPEIYHLTAKFHADNPDAVKFLSDGHANDLTTNIFEKLPKIFLDDKPNDGREYIQIYGLDNRQRVFKFVRRDYITSHATLTKWKVFVPKSNGSGALGEVVSTPLVGSPLVGSTQTFISVGAFDTEAEARACIAYIRSKFCRAMLGILKVTQHNPPQTWSKVPLQDFTSASDIDWSGDVDAQLYRKYNLSAAEIDFIESHVKAME